ncbi:MULTISPECIES: bile acid:sodium symporter family protein [Loigolactobacillus]|uniref:Symporter n=1 Tax=Loigolactobacillus backii TaxID=375175 RepID=A0A192H020_9LACO|nr:MULTISPECIES: bile acid:sodium symporter family protein [Loigolactobacillus]ANK61592.1 symporter [Loigolactobacillus backii]ANK69210.1 symporter [Loigolactobacillus backii]MDA5388090.1 bile acid:sodium symporter family protein [Loigolactobacillus backii]MDA5390582.1 bile acid:sodium symporter family protein [Loigolactobacillus backii]
MKHAEMVGNWVSKWFTWLVVAVAAFSFFVPSIGVAIAPHTSLLLGIVLFGMGLTLTRKDFARIFRHPWPVFAGTVAHYVIMPGIAYLLCLIFHLNGPTAVGVILVGSCPSGTSSNVMAYLAGGDVALDVSIGMLSTLLAPIMLPTLLLLYAGNWVTVPATSLFLGAIRIVLLPIFLGVLVHTIFGKRIETVNRILPLVSQTAILLIVASVFAANQAHLFTAETALVIPVVILHNLSGYGLGFLFSKLIRLNDPQRKAITFEVGMQDSALGATLAMKYFHPAAAIPSTIFSIWHNISGSILSTYWRNKLNTDKSAEPKTTKLQEN